MPRPCITLLTDFGWRDTYVGQMKGVIAAINPDANVVDLTHDIAPQQITQGALALADAVDVFPPGTIHVAVVDPGVGSDRRLIAAEVGRQKFVCPDNGLLTFVWQRATQRRAVVLDEPRWWRTSVSNTFHGRDVFAPVAAAWSLGHELTQFGSPTDSPLVEVPVAEVAIRDSAVSGVVLTSDSFGNLITNIERRVIPVGATHVEIEIGGHHLSEIATCYADRAPGEALALFGSTERLEIAVVNGNAAERLNIQTGQPVEVRWRGVQL
jgi:S-adenosyl-L-methionine hydrolase (adenosine-forming)